jgi:hypothetical protein
MSWIFALLGLATAIAGGGAIATGWPLVPLERGWTLVIAGAAVGSGGLICLALAALMGETRRMRRTLERALTELAWARPIEREPVHPLEREPPPERPFEREFAPAVWTTPAFEKVEPVMPVMPAAAPLGSGAPLGPLEPEPEAGSSRRRQEASAVPAANSPGALDHRGTFPDAPEPEEGRFAESFGSEAASRPEELQPARSFSVGDTSFVVFTDGTIEARTPKGARRFGSMEEVRGYLEESASS